MNNPKCRRCGGLTIKAGKINKSQAYKCTVCKYRSRYDEGIKPVGEPSDKFPCPKCGGDTVRAGKRKGRQVYKCKSCGYRGVKKPATLGRPKTATFCSECGVPSIHAKGLCRKCYQNNWNRLKRKQSK